MRWTEEEKEMLYSDMTSREIAIKVDKPIDLVRKVRYYHTGHYDAIEMPVGREYISPKEAEARILKLAKDMGVKLKEA